jgi:flagellar hook-length control protein FliK
VKAPGEGESEKNRDASRVDPNASARFIDDRRPGAGSSDTVAATPKTTTVTSASEGAPEVVAVTRVTQPLSPLASADSARQFPVDATPMPEGSTTSGGNVPDPETAQRLVQSLRMQFLRGGGDAVVQLRPEHLGAVTVSLRVEQGSVAAHVTAADPVVAEWLRAHQDSLRDGLQANGLTLDRLSIDRDGRSPDRRERREAPPRQRFRAASEAQSTFELMT